MEAENPSEKPVEKPNPAPDPEAMEIAPDVPSADKGILDFINAVRLFVNHVKQSVMIWRL